MRFTLDVAGFLDNSNVSGKGGMAFCLLLHSSTFLTIGFHGGTASLVVITLDRYWKIVHAVKHREYHRRWMVYAGVFLPWLNGIAAHLIPAISSTRIVNGMCVTPVFRTEVPYFQFCILH